MSSCRSTRAKTYPPLTMKQQTVAAAIFNFLVGGYAVAESLPATFIGGAVAPVCYSPYPAIVQLAGEDCEEVRVIAHIWGHCDGTVSGALSELATRSSDGQRLRTKVSGTIDFDNIKGLLLPLGLPCKCGPGDEMPTDFAMMEERVSQLPSCRQCKLYQAVQVLSGQPIKLTFKSIAVAVGQEDNKCVQRIVRAVRPQNR